MIERRKKFVVMFLVFSLVALSGNLMAKEKGVYLSIQKTDGEEIGGELITVKKDSLLLVSEVDGYDLPVAIGDIDVITVKNKSLMLELGVLGFIVGAAARGLMHTEVEKGETEQEATAHQVQKLLVPGLIGAGVGVIAGSAFGINKKIQIRGKSDAEIQDALEKLSKKAREPNFQ
jgi:hypothetical protein